MKRLLIVAVLLSAVAQVQAGRVQSCPMGYKYTGLNGGRTGSSYICSASVTRGMRAPACPRGYVLNSEKSIPGYVSYTCSNLS